MKIPPKSINQFDLRARACSDDACGGSVELQIDQLRAAQWLVCIEELNANYHSKVLEQFQESMGDDYWLARWKREYVVFNFNASTLPEILCAMVSDEAAASCEPAVIEDMVATLARFRR